MNNQSKNKINAALDDARAAIKAEAQTVRYTIRSWEAEMRLHEKREDQLRDEIDRIILQSFEARDIWAPLIADLKKAARAELLAQVTCQENADRLLTELIELQGALRNIQRIR